MAPFQQSARSELQIIVLRERLGIFFGLFAHARFFPLIFFTEFNTVLVIVWQCSIFQLSRRSGRMSMRLKENVWNFFELALSSNTRSARIGFVFLLIAPWTLCEIFRFAFLFPGNSVSRYYLLGYFANSSRTDLVKIVAYNFGLPLLVALTLFVFIEILRPRSRWFVFICFNLYVFQFLNLQNPQTLEDFNWYFRWIFLFLPLQRWIVLVAIQGLFLISMRPSRPLRRVPAYVSWAILAFYVFYVNNPQQQTPSSYPVNANVQRSSSPAHIILVGIDGLDPEILEKLIATHQYPHLEKFVSNSEWYKKAYTEIARTQSSLTSLLSSLPPSQHGQRVTLQNTKKPAEFIDHNPLLQKWHEDGGNISVRLSDTNFIDLQHSKIIDDYRTPSSPSFSLLGPHLIGNKLIYVFFNNVIGAWLFPEVIENSAFQTVYRPEFFLDKVIDDILGFKKPTIFLSHMTKLHWPGSFPYPYYVFRNSNDRLESQFAYDSLALRPERKKQNRIEYNRFNRVLYEQGHRYVLDSYLEPLISKLESTKEIEKSTLVIYSDHSENFNTLSIPNSFRPTHGSWIPPLDRSYRTTLIVHRPSSNQKKEYLEPVPIWKAIPIAMSPESPFADPILAETDWWTTSNHPRQLGDTDPSDYHFQFDKDRPILADEQVELQLLAKTRTMFWKDRTYALFATERGYIWSQFPESEDGNSNLLKSEAWEKFRDAYIADFSSGKLPDLHIEGPISKNSFSTTFVPRPQFPHETSLHLYFKLQRLVWTSSLISEVEKTILDKTTSLVWRQLLLSGYLLRCEVGADRLVFDKKINFVINDALFDPQLLLSKQTIERLSRCWKQGRITTFNFPEFIKNGKNQVNRKTFQVLDVLPDRSMVYLDDVERPDWPFWTGKYDICEAPAYLVKNLFAFLASDSSSCKDQKVPQ